MVTDDTLDDEEGWGRLWVLEWGLFDRCWLSGDDLVIHIYWWTDPFGGLLGFKGKWLDTLMWWEGIWQGLCRECCEEVFCNAFDKALSRSISAITLAEGTSLLSSNEILTSALFVLSFLWYTLANIRMLRMSSEQPMAIVTVSAVLYAWYPVISQGPRGSVMLCWWVLVSVLTHTVVGVSVVPVGSMLLTVLGEVLFSSLVRVKGSGRTTPSYRSLLLWSGNWLWLDVALPRPVLCSSGIKRSQRLSWCAL